MVGEEPGLVDLAGHRGPPDAVPAEELDGPADLGHAHLAGHVGQGRERRVGVVADRQDRGASTRAADRLGDRDRIAAPAGENADHFAGEAGGADDLAGDVHGQRGSGGVGDGG